MTDMNHTTIMAPYGCWPPKNTIEMILAEYGQAVYAAAHTEK